MDLTLSPPRPRFYKLSPSDLVFLWQECPRCFYQKVVDGVQRPRSPMPKIFTNIDSLMKVRLNGRRTEDLAPGMPPGALDFGEKWVESTPIRVPGSSITVALRGRLDIAVRLDDGTHGVVDFKTAERRAAHVPLYGRQLHAYAWALERPASGRFRLDAVRTLGLLVFEPDTFSNQVGSGSLTGRLTWIDVPRNDGAFTEFLGQVVSVLDRQTPPLPNEDCAWCQRALYERIT
jgi:hypothetical protein